MIKRILHSIGNRLLFKIYILDIDKNWPIKELQCKYKIPQSWWYQWYLFMSSDITSNPLKQRLTHIKSAGKTGSLTYAETAIFLANPGWPLLGEHTWLGFAILFSRQLTQANFGGDCGIHEPNEYMYCLSEARLRTDTHHLQLILFPKASQKENPDSSYGEPDWPFLLRGTRKFTWQSLASKKGDELRPLI